VDGVSTSNFEQIAAFCRKRTFLGGKRSRSSRFSSPIQRGIRLFRLDHREPRNPLWDKSVPRQPLTNSWRNDKLDANSLVQQSQWRGQVAPAAKQFRRHFRRPSSKEQDVFFFRLRRYPQPKFYFCSYGVATDAEKQGGFRELCTFEGKLRRLAGYATILRQLWDPFKGASFDTVNNVPTRTIFIKNNDLLAGA